MPDSFGNPTVGEPNYIAPPAGLINSPQGSPAVSPAPSVTEVVPAQAAPAIASASGYTPTPYTVPTTVQERIKQIVAEDSPLMQQAKQVAVQQMNARGLLNSSQAIGAAQGAVITAATPIAQADAAAIQRASEATANAQNASAAFKAGAVNTAENVNAQLKTSLNVSNAAAVTGALSDSAKAANTAALAVMDNATKLEIAKLNTQNQQLLQTNVSAANAFSNVVSQIGSIATNPNLDATAKSNAIQSQINLLNQFLQQAAAVARTDQASISELDLSGFFANVTGLVGTATTPPAGTPPAAPAPTSGLPADAQILWESGNYYSPSTGKYYDPAGNVTGPYF